MKLLALLAIIGGAILLGLGFAGIGVSHSISHGQMTLHLTELTLGGLLIAGVGYGGLLWVGRRAFNRTNLHGVQEYSSFGAAFRSNVAETAVRLPATIMVTVGGLVFAVGGAFLVFYIFT